jgi:type I restriction enzyme S subunit
MAIKNLSTEQINETLFPLPPLAEQRRIVAKVEQFLALCGELEARQTAAHEKRTHVVRSALAHLTGAKDETDFKSHANFILHKSPFVLEDVQALRQTILSLAVRGRLTDRRAGDGVATDILLVTIKRRENLGDRKRRVERLESVGNGTVLPVNWTWCSLTQICLNVTDGFHNTPNITTSGVPYITAQHIRPNTIDFDNSFFVSKADHQGLVSKTKPRKGDILVVNIGAGSGNAAIIAVDIEFSFKNVAILNLHDAVDSPYIFYALLESRPAIFEELTKGGAQPFLSLGVLRNIPIPLPPLAEQKRIVTKVDELMRWCDELETRLSQAHKSGTHLLDAILHQLLTDHAKA